MTPDPVLPAGYTVEDLRPEHLAPEGDAHPGGERFDCDGSHSAAAELTGEHLDGINF